MTARLSWVAFEDYLSQIAKPDKPLPPDRGIVRALMLWPDDIGRREQSATRAFLNYLDDIGDAPSDVKNFAYKIARNAVGAIELEKAEDERVRRGLFVGSVLYSMTVCVEDVDFNFGFHVNRCNRLFLDEKNVSGKQIYRFTKKTFDNTLWPVFRPVSHYWAASYQYIKIDDDNEFPCAVDKLQEFLALAEFIRGKAENRRPFKSPSTILRPGEALGLPPEFARLRFQSL